MPYSCSVTRLRIRNVRLLIPFFIAAARCVRQAAASPELIHGQTVSEFPFVHWTVTIWRTKSAMQSYLGTGAHLQVMPKLRHWCSEAHTTHFTWEGEEPPDLATCAQKLRAGKRAHVLHPTPLHEHASWKLSARPSIRPFPNLRGT